MKNQKIRGTAPGPSQHADKIWPPFVDGHADDEVRGASNHHALPPGWLRLYHAVPARHLLAAPTSDVLRGRNPNGVPGHGDIAHMAEVVTSLLGIFLSPDNY